MTKYTEEQHSFFQMFVPGHTYQEIVDAYNEKFPEKITFARVKAYMGNHRLNNGLSGRFKKGQVPANKGKKGSCAKGCEKTWFKEGHTPRNHKPIGSERIDSKDGYLIVKIAEPSVWRAKHRVIWEQMHGDIPKDHVVIFSDGNRRNFDVDNLILISKEQNAMLNRYDLRSSNKEFTETGIILATLLSAQRKARKRKSHRSRTSKTRTIKALKQKEC